MAAIAALPQHERTVVHLFYLQGFSLQEIAERLKLPTTTVKKRLQTARGRMRQRIDEVRSATVELVWDPPWSKEKMSEAALLELGLL